MQPLLSAMRLIFLDETGVTTNMVRRWGPTPRGQRVRGYAPAGLWKVTTFLAGLDRDGIVALCRRSADEPGIFTQYIRQYLVPELQPGEVVILDNLSSRKGAEAGALVEACGAKLLFPPPYSPDSTRSKWPSPSSSACSARPVSAPGDSASIIIHGRPGDNE